MGRQAGDQSRLFYAFNLDELIPERHLLRRINPIVTCVLAELRGKLRPFYSEIGRPSIDPELMLRMLIAEATSAAIGMDLDAVRIAIGRSDLVAGRVTPAIVAQLQEPPTPS